MLYYTEFYGEYGALNNFEKPNQNPPNYAEGTSDLISYDGSPDNLNQFETRQEISADYNAKLYNIWLQEKSSEIENTDQSGYGIPKYRALTLLNKIERGKYDYIMYLNVDSYEAGLYDEENGYYISPAPINDMVLTAEEIEDQELSEDHAKEFDNEFKSNDENDTAFYYDR